jgi:putative ABC transport system permease protein
MVGVGLTEISTSFGSEGNIVLSRENFLRIVPGHPGGLVHVGLVRIRAGADRAAIQAQFCRMLGAAVSVLTPQEFVDFELRFWKTNAPVGFIFTMGTIVGFFIGFTVVYQILYAEVTNHLAQYATMKAIGFADRFLLWLIMKQAFLLSLIGYVPGSLLAVAFYQVIKRGTGIPVTPTWSRAGGLLVATCVMCVLGGVMATRRLRAADPADMF